MIDTYAVIGNPISHSKSPLIHSEFSKQTQQHIRYQTILSPLNGFAAAIDIFRQSGGKGLNVTLPFKVEAYKISTQLTEQASSSHAVNTLVFDDDKIYGDNTDGIGLIRDIVVNLRFAITAKRVLLCGAGGAARGIMLPLLKQEPLILTISNRTVQKAHELRRQFPSYKNIVSGNYKDILGKKFDLVINATSTSLINKSLPLPKGIFSAKSLVYDLMYGNMNTPFLQFARKEGVTHLSDGIGMLVEQAAESFFIWRGVRPKTKPVIKMLCKRIQNDMRNK